MKVGLGVWVIEGVCGFFFQAEDGIRDLVRSRGLGDVYKRQGYTSKARVHHVGGGALGYGSPRKTFLNFRNSLIAVSYTHLTLPTIYSV